MNNTEDCRSLSSLIKCTLGDITQANQKSRFPKLYHKLVGNVILKLVNCSADARVFPLPPSPWRRKALGCDISSHLQNHHLSRENVREKDLILERAGLLELTEEQVKNMTVCPAHGFTLGRYWPAPKTCQYPKHWQENGGD